MTEPLSIEYLVSLYGAKYAHSSLTYGTDEYEAAAAESLAAFDDVIAHVVALTAERNGLRGEVELLHKRTSKEIRLLEEEILDCPTTGWHAPLRMTELCKDG